MRTNKRIGLIVLGGALFAALGIALVIPVKTTNMATLDFFVDDNNFDYRYEVNEELTFTLFDSAFAEENLVWYFGNGDTSRISNNVKYTYTKEGTYMVTLELNNRYRAIKYLDIVNIPKKEAVDSIPIIYGDDIGYVNEPLVFSCYGPGISVWFWEFGETGTVDAYEGQVVYTYQTPGDYQVKLKTNRSEFYVLHDIKILPLFEVIEEPKTVDSMLRISDAIKSHFQAISLIKVTEKDKFYHHLKEIENYTNKNTESVVVVVNGEKYNDLFSYCQGLHCLEANGEKTLVIKDVKLDDFRNIKRIDVTQSIVRKN